MWDMKWIVLVVLITGTTGQNHKICESEECMKLGKRMRSMMNTKVDPCDDFYEFSCGNYDNISRVLPEIVAHQEHDWWDLVDFIKNFKPIKNSERIALEFLKKCQNTTEDEKVDVGIWEDEKKDLTDILIEMAKVDYQTGLLDNQVWPLTEPNNLVLYIKSGLDKLPELKNISNNILKENKDLSVPKLTNLKDIEENELEFLNMTKYAIGLLPEKYKHNFQTWDIGVFLNELKLVDKVIKTVGPKIIKQMLFEKWNNTLTSYLVRDPGLRSLLCFARTEKMFPGTMGMIFVRNFVKTEKLEKSQELFENLKKVFDEMLIENTWLDEEMKKDLRIELQTMKSSIGLSEDHKSGEIDKIYERVEEIQSAEDQSYLTLVRNLLKMNSEETYLRVSQMSEIELALRPMKFGANFFPSTHRVSVAAILLNFPYIDKELPDWNAVSSVGYIVGHEIGHAFDASSFFDYKLSHKYNITSKTKNEFDKRIKCLTQKYDKFQFPDGSQSNGSFTKDEDSADLIGFNLSWRLFEKMLKSRNNLKLPDFEKFSLKQQFFQRMAYVWCAPAMERNNLAHQKSDSHSAYKFRINGMMSNSKHFANAFQCEENSPMNPVKKCPLFK